MNPTPWKALKLDPRFTHVSNINCMCRSCGKPKAKRFARFFLAAGRGFSAARLRRPIAPAPVAASMLPHTGASPQTLNDTELRENFRRKNTPRKSFLGHAQVLIDVLLEAAKARPTWRCAAQRGKCVCPQS